jgi:hypothetical protein
MANKDIFSSAPRNEGAFAGPCHSHNQDESIIWIWFGKASKNREAPSLIGQLLSCGFDIHNKQNSDE